jgi:hypothetical protein
MGPPPWVPTYRDLHAHRCSVVTPFINLPSHYCFRRIDDRCEIRQTMVASPSNGINADRAGNRPAVFKRTRRRRASSAKIRLHSHVPIDYLRSLLVPETKGLFHKYSETFNFHSNFLVPATERSEWNISLAISTRI